MSRPLLITLIAIAVVIASAGAVLYLAYGLSEELPSQAVVTGLSDSTRIAVSENGSAFISAPTRADAYAALGYLHTQNHVWSMVLWRRTALGRLSEWFGDNLLELDRLTRKLQLGRLARRDFEQLPPESKQLLEAYANGVNSALREERVRMTEELVVLEQMPSRWEPWHTLAVERLFAWLAAEPLNPDSVRAAPPSARNFFEADRLLRDWLHIHGFENSVAWTASDSSGGHFYQRHVYGASALTIFQDVKMEWPGTSVTGATLIGTPFMPAGVNESFAWSVLLSSEVRLERVTRDSLSAPTLHERILGADGREYLLPIEAGSEGIYFEPATPRYNIRTDTSGARPEGRVLRWPGLVSGTDMAAWEALQTGSVQAFSLIQGDGLVVSRDGSRSVIGNPRIVANAGGGLFVGNSVWSAQAATRLDSLLRAPEQPIDPARLRTDHRSTWAARLAPPLVNAAIAVPDQSSPVAEALAYLRNWDFSYDRASIAASIFDTWMTAYRDSLHTLPEPAIPDSMLSENLLRYEMLVIAVRMLSTRFGDDLSQWRWERVQQRNYRFPVWSADSLITIDGGAMSSTRYASIDVPGAGHPTTLLWGPSSIQDALPSPASWEGWLSTAAWDNFRVYTYRFPANTFFGRYLVSDRAPDTATIAAPDFEHEVVLVPR